MKKITAGNDSGRKHDRLVSTGVNTCVISWMPREVSLGILAGLVMSL